jgi:hypothetical protein
MENALVNKTVQRAVNGHPIILGQLVLNFPERMRPRILYEYIEGVNPAIGDPQGMFPEYCGNFRAFHDGNIHNKCNNVAKTKDVLGG